MGELAVSCDNLERFLSAFFQLEERLRTRVETPEEILQEIDNALKSISPEERLSWVNKKISGTFPPFFAKECQGYLSDSDSDKVLQLPPVVKAVCIDSPYSEKILRILLKNGANPNAGESTTGLTALHIAAYKGNVAYLGVLFSYGAIPLSAKGYFPADFAIYPQSLSTHLTLIVNKAYMSASSESREVLATLPQLKNMDPRYQAALIRVKKIGLEKLKKNNGVPLKGAIWWANVEPVRELPEQDEIGVIQ